MKYFSTLIILIFLCMGCGQTDSADVGEYLAELKILQFTLQVSQR